jgi:hypothetical protein
MINFFPEMIYIQNTNVLKVLLLKCDANSKC